MPQFLGQVLLDFKPKGPLSMIQTLLLTLMTSYTTANLFFVGFSVKKISNLLF